MGNQLSQFIERDKAHIVAMTGSYFRGDSEAVLTPTDENKFETVTYTYYEQLNGYSYLKALDIGYFFYTGKYTDAVMKVLDPSLKQLSISQTSTPKKVPKLVNILKLSISWMS